MSRPHLRNSPPPAVVIGLHATALGVIRSLADEGIPVYALGDDLTAPAAATRLCRRKIACPIADPEALVAALLRLAKELGEPAVLFPCGDADVLTLSEHRAVLEPHFRIALPEHGLLETLIDKRRFYELAFRTGIPIAPTYLVADEAGVEAAAAGIRFPCVVKPWRNNAEWRSVSGGLPVLKIESADDLRAAFARVRTAQPQVIVQQWIDGTDEDVWFVLACYDRESRPLAACTGRKIRQWPPLIGSSACVEVRENPELERRSLELLERWSFRGLGSLEWKQDRRSGEYYVVEPTAGRCDLQSPCALLAGLNLPHLAYCDLAGLPLPKGSPGAPRGRWIHEERELYAALHYMRRGELSPVRWLGSVLVGRCWTFAALRDPMPALRLLQSFARKLMVRMAAAR